MCCGKGRICIVHSIFLHGLYHHFISTLKKSFFLANPFAVFFCFQASKNLYFNRNVSFSGFVAKPLFNENFEQYFSSFEIKSQIFCASCERKKGTHPSKTATKKKHNYMIQKKNDFKQISKQTNKWKKLREEQKQIYKMNAK